MIRPLIRIFDFITPVLLMALICFCLSILYPEYKKTERIRQNLRRLKIEKLRCQAENEALKRELARTDDPEYIIRAAREGLNLVRPGEKIIEFK